MGSYNDIEEQSEHPPGVPTFFDEEGEAQEYAGNIILCRIPPTSPLSKFLVSLCRKIAASPYYDDIVILPPQQWHVTIFDGVSDKIRKPGYWPAHIETLEYCNSLFATRLKNFDLRDVSRDVADADDGDDGGNSNTLSVRGHRRNASSRGSALGTSHQRSTSRSSAYAESRMGAHSRNASASSNISTGAPVSGLPPYRMKVAGFEPLELGVGLSIEGREPREERRLRTMRDRFSEVLEIRRPDHESYSFTLNLAYLLRKLSREEETGLTKLLMEHYAEMPKEFELGAPEFCNFTNVLEYNTLTSLGGTTLPVRTSGEE